MKTSNKILLIFFIVAFIVPVFIFMGFRAKIKKGEFTMIKTPGFFQSNEGGTLQPFKVLKVVGPEDEGVFTCHIIPIPAGQASYNYTDYYQAHGLTVRQKGDTLLITYTGTKVNFLKDNALTNLKDNTLIAVYRQIQVNLRLPVIKNIVAEGAGIKIDSINLNTNPEIYVNLSKNAALTLAGNGNITPTSTNTASHSAIAEKSTGQFNKVTIRATDSHVTLYMPAWIKDLNLQLSGLSTITIDDRCRINQLSGSISGSAKIEANWENIRKLAALTGK